MAANHKVPNLVEALRAHLATSVTGLTVVANSDYRLFDELEGNVLGRFIPTPYAIISGEVATDQTPVSCSLTIVVIHSAEQSTLAAHNSHVAAVMDELFDLTSTPLTADSSFFLLLDHGHQEPRFTTEGRAYRTETRFMGVAV